MKDTYVNAKLIAKDTIRLIVYSALSLEKIEPRLVVDGEIGEKLTPNKLTTLGATAIADFRFPKPLELGHSYFLSLPNYGQIPLNVEEAVFFDGFDEAFYYQGEDLGAIYSKDKTSFAIWAPLASKVILKYKGKKEKNWNLLTLERKEKGVFKGLLEGDHEGLLYRYLITNNEITVETTDPYAKGSTLNGLDSVVIDFSRLSKKEKSNALPVLNSPTDAIIYEAHVRDMTISSQTDIVRKGTFLGLIEQGRKSKGGHPAGFDYLLSLHITHIQLLPIYDYKSVDEAHPDKKYNWGYDPAQYFVPEGSYASVLEDPLSRIRDCKTMIEAFHEKGVRVVMDVVYNHVYEYQDSVFEKVVPGYYFRRRGNGKIANTSGCGNDLASERPMVKKLIIDACKWWIDEYGVDGFRFDLMGIIDVDTLNKIKDYALAKDPSFLLYGEGWNMGGEVNVPLGRMDNYAMLPDFGFFNDFYRERAKDYWGGNGYAIQDYKYAYLSSSLNFVNGARFLNAKQTINYVECHDNGTLFDYLSKRRGDLKKEDILNLIKAINASILLSFGIPFIHMGQEIGMSKWGEDNTYNKGDYYNKFSYALLDERYEMAESMAKVINYRRKRKFLRNFDPTLIDQILDIEDKEGMVIIKFADPNNISPFSKIVFYLNSSEKAFVEETTSTSFLCFGGKGELKDKKAYIPARSIWIGEE